MKTLHGRLTSDLTLPGVLLIPIWGAVISIGVQLALSFVIPQPESNTNLTPIIEGPAEILEDNPQGGYIIKYELCGELYSKREYDQVRAAIENIRQRAEKNIASAEEVNRLLAFDLKCGGLSAQAWYSWLEAPFLEELQFRLLPLGLAILLFSGHIGLVLLVLVASAAWFGSIHQAGQAQLAAVGLVWGYCFMRASQLKWRRLHIGFAVSFSAHALANFLITWLSYALVSSPAHATGRMLIALPIALLWISSELLRKWEASEKSKKGSITVDNPKEK